MAGATALAYAVAAIVPRVNPSTVAVLLGAAATGLGLHLPVLRPGTQLAAHRLLRVSVVLLGLQLSVPDLLGLGLPGLAIVALTVTVTFTGTRLLGRLFGVPPGQALLVATGFSICGASAVAAVHEVADSDEDDRAVAVALVTLCGSLAIFLLPLLRVPLGLDAVAFGQWVGASVHDVGQTVATASQVPGALSTAVVVKLTRVVLLAPLVAAVALGRSRAAAGERAGDGYPTAHHPSGRRPPVVPLFVAGFLAAIVLSSTHVLPAQVMDGLATTQHVLLTSALVGLGTGISLPMLARTGRRALALGLASWLLVGCAAYLGVLVLGR